MLRSIFFKEWIKIGKVSLFSGLLGIIAITGIYLTVRHDLILNDAEKYWDTIINHRYIYFSIFQFLPLITGLLIGIAQFVPEITDKRIKLSLHLPLNEEGIILKMMTFGAMVIIFIFMLLFLLFFGWGRLYFPYEIVSMTALTITPWFLSGLAAYFLISFIILEPIWKYRIFYIIIAAVFISLFYKSDTAGAYRPALIPLAAATMLISIALLFSIYRFRKGEM